MIVHGEDISPVLEKQPICLTERLQSLLGTQTDVGWYRFMDTVALKLPFLMGDSGRPTAKQIMGSIIGQSGFTSWFSYHQVELGLKDSKWKTWKRAYQYVLEHGYLRKNIISPTIIIKVIDSGIAEFPPNAEALQEILDDINKSSEVRKQSSKKALNDMISSLMDVQNTDKKTIEELAQERDTHRKNTKLWQQRYLKKCEAIEARLIPLLEALREARKGSILSWLGRFWPRAEAEAENLNKIVIELEEIKKMCADEQANRK